MKKNFYTLFIYILIVCGFIYTDDLKQNNDENLLITSESQKSFEASKTEHTIIQFPEIADLKSSHISQIETFLDETFEDYDLISAKTLTKKESLEDQIHFYQQHPLLSIQLATKSEISFILITQAEERFKLPLLFKKMEEQMPLNSYSVSGLSYLNYEIGKTTLDIKKFILPGLIILSLLLSFFLLKNFSETLVFFHFPLLAIVLAQLFLKFFYGESNVLSSLAPLVNFVVILSLNFHLFYSLKSLKTFKELKRLKTKPILFMLITTVMGIASLSISDVPAIKIFSFTTSASLLLSSFYNLFVFQILYKKESLSNLKTIIIGYLPPKVQRPLLYLSFTLPFLFGIFFINNIPIQVEALYFFPQKSKLILDAKKIEKTIIGTPLLEIVFPGINLAQNYDEVKKINKLEKELLSIIGAESKRVSQSSLIEEANYIYSGEMKLPDYQAAAFPLLGQVPSALSPSQIDEDYRVILFGQSRDTLEYQELLKELENRLKKEKREYYFSGVYYRLMKSQTGIITTLVKSFLIGLLLVSLVVGVLFRGLREFFIFLIVNIIPPILTLISFKLFGLSLNLATVLTFSVSFGIIVDSTIHIIHAVENKMSFQTMSETVYTPMIFSNLILIIGFLNFTFHHFLPIWQFGLSMSLTIFFGLIYDLFILPSINKKGP